MLFSFQPLLVPGHATLAPEPMLAPADNELASLLEPLLFPGHAMLDPPQPLLAPGHAILDL